MAITQDILSRYATLLVHYCVELKAGEKLYLSTTTLAEPLVREIYREATKLGAIVEVDFQFENQSKIYYQHANDWILEQPPVLKKAAMESFDAYIYIKAPYDLNETQGLDMKKKQKLSLIHI